MTNSHKVIEAVAPTEADVWKRQVKQGGEK
jgi:hypothetical protein